MLPQMQVVSVAAARSCQLAGRSKDSKAFWTVHHVHFAETAAAFACAVAYAAFVARAYVALAFVLLGLGMAGLQTGAASAEIVSHAVAASEGSYYEGD